MSLLVLDQLLQCFRDCLLRERARLHQISITGVSQTFHCFRVQSYRKKSSFSIQWRFWLSTSFHIIILQLHIKLFSCLQSIVSIIESQGLLVLKYFLKNILYYKNVLCIIRESTILLIRNIRRTLHAYNI